jgi:hypothetical protein
MWGRNVTNRYLQILNATEEEKERKQQQIFMH